MRWSGRDAGGAELLGIRASGTMPHALMIIFKHAMGGDHSLAWKFFDEAVPSDVPRIVLADTFLDEREEVGGLAIKSLGNKLAGGCGWTRPAAGGGGT